MDLPQFSKRMQVIANNVNANADILVKTVALAVDQSVVVATPIDEGTARSNWVVAVGNTPSDQIEAYVKGTEGSTASANIQAAIAQARIEVKKYKKGDEIHITNNLDYINELNKGSSHQADPGFVERAARTGIMAVQGVKLLE